MNLWRRWTQDLRQYEDKSGSIIAPPISITCNRRTSSHLGLLQMALGHRDQNSLLALRSLCLHQLVLNSARATEKRKLREEIRGLSDDLTLKDDLTVEDLDLLYELEELEQIISYLKGMPIGRRKLQTAVDEVEKQ